MSDNGEHRCNSGSGAGWFWLGTGIGLVVSASVVVIANEFRYIRKRHLDQGVSPEDYDIVEDLQEAVYDGLNVLAHAAESIRDTFNDAARERIRFSLDPTPGTSAGSEAWYTGDEEDEA